MYCSFNTCHLTSTELCGTSNFLQVPFGVIVKMALEIILLAVSHTPMGLTPGHLSRAISLHASRAEIPLGSTYVVQSLLDRSAREWHKSCEANLKEVHSLLQTGWPCRAFCDQG